MSRPLFDSFPESLKWICWARFARRMLARLLLLDFPVPKKAVVVAKRRTRFFVPVPKRCLGAKIRSSIKFFKWRVLSESVVAFCLGRLDICATV